MLINRKNCTIHTWCFHPFIEKYFLIKFARGIWISFIQLWCNFLSATLTFFIFTYLRKQNEYWWSPLCYNVPSFCLEQVMYGRFDWYACRPAQTCLSIQIIFIQIFSEHKFGYSDIYKYHTPTGSMLYFVIVSIESCFRYCGWYFLFNSPNSRKYQKCPANKSREF